VLRYKQPDALRCQMTVPSDMVIEARAAVSIKTYIEIYI
jgi:hypothetical protein